MATRSAARRHRLRDLELRRARRRRSARRARLHRRRPFGAAPPAQAARDARSFEAERDAVAPVRRGHSAPTTRASSAPPARSRRLTPTSRSPVGSALLPFGLKPPVPVTNLAQFGWGSTSPPRRSCSRSRLTSGPGSTSTPMANGLHGWNGTGALTPIKRFAQMFSGAGVGVDGTEWYFPQRLTDDSGGDRQRQREPGPGGVRHQDDDGSPPPAQPADLRVRRRSAARRSSTRPQRSPRSRGSRRAT